MDFFFFFQIFWGNLVIASYRYFKNSSMWLSSGSHIFELRFQAVIVFSLDCIADLEVFMHNIIPHIYTLITLTIEKSDKDFPYILKGVLFYKMPVSDLKSLSSIHSQPRVLPLVSLLYCFLLFVLLLVNLSETWILMYFLVNVTHISKVSSLCVWKQNS